MGKVSTKIAQPECHIGYPFRQLEGILGDRMDEFSRWLAGQTISQCDGRKYNYDTKEYEPTGCGPHGFVAYRWDVERFLAGKPIID